MKKIVNVLCAFVLVFCMTVAAGATTYTFEDMIDNWTVLGVASGAVPIVEGVPLSYSHNINDQVNLAAGDRVTSAALELDFINDGNDSVTRFFGTILWDNREFSKVGFDGTTWVDLGEVDSSVYSMILNIDWLNDDGVLDVVITASNPGWNPATAWLDHSRLYGQAEAAPVPEPGSILLLGAGLLGLGLYGRKRIKS
jgi:hypothetical protein